MALIGTGEFLGENATIFQGVADRRWLGTHASQRRAEAIKAQNRSGTAGARASVHQIRMQDPKKSVVF